MSFLDALQQIDSRSGRTENGALTHTTTHNEVLNFFALAGAMRNNTTDAVNLFKKAYAEDAQLATRALFYIRDIRGGQGERDLFRTLWKELPAVTQDRVLGFIPEYGRWDDLFLLAGGPGAGGSAAGRFADQLNADEAAMARGESVSLMAKWAPSENTSSATTRAQARSLARKLGMPMSEYRRRIVALRKYIKLLEHKMSANQWDEIDYEHLPSQAARKHTKAFKRHDGTRYEGYLEDVMNGDAKMNASTVYTYEVMDMVRKGDGRSADAMWKSLPDWTNGSNAIVVADVSGSMTGRPMDVSVSLALYFAEHNTGPFQNYFITFTTTPKLQKVVGNDLTSRLRNIQNADWGGSTNVQGVFDLLLAAAKKNKAGADDMPKVVYIISDMEFNMATGHTYWNRRAKETNYEAAARKFEEAGFVLPHIVFWNVDARGTNVPATEHDGRVTLISGLSQSTFRYAVEGKTPVELMNEVLNGERYAQIVL